VFSTLQENELVYTKSEVKRAKQAHTFLKTSRYPSLEDAVHLLEDGNVENVPCTWENDYEESRASTKFAICCEGTEARY
jgi:hypothetical protein